MQGQLRIDDETRTSDHSCYQPKTASYITRDFARTFSIVSQTPLRVWIR